jgi:3' terminal RNA ribose 2'-O-methyltransferase Hen1
VLLPVMDDAKHYWVSAQEIDKLLRSGEGWLAGHPERDLIADRYLAHQRSMIDDATARLIESDDTPVTVEDLEAEPADTPLRTRRADAVLQALRDVDAARVADLGCGPGALLTKLAADPGFTQIIGTDVGARALAVAAKRLHLDQAGDRQRSRIQLLQSSLTYQDDRLIGLDAAVLMEVIEHIDPSRLVAMEDAVFAHARPAAVVVTTPNADYNPLYAGLSIGAFRHPDHRFEWSRDEFGNWATAVGEKYGYRVEFRPVGDVHAEFGAPTQLALFRREAGQ